ncbi:MAG TPA: lysylphosphatidylglycerol synthase transmembrane domain-containing protein [Gemmatimonadaceae bacterium]
MNPQLGRAIRWLITLAIVVFLVVFARTIDWHAAWQSIRSASFPLLLIALAANFASLAFKAVRWWMFLRAAGARSLPLALRATIAGAGLNNVLVANGGEAARVVFVTRATGVSSSTVLATLALERLFDPVGFVILIVYASMAFDLPPALERWRIPAQVALALIAVLLAWFLYSSRKAQPAELIESREEAAGFWQKIKAYLAGFALSARALANFPRFVAALVLSMLSWIGQVLTFKYAAAAAHVDMSIAASIATLIAINLGLLIRATPGNVGFFQFVFAITAEQFGIDRSDAIAVSLLIQTLQIIPMTILGAALAPEFIFRKAKVSGSVAKEGEELARIASES